jgi:putative intracellular protease/amidase
MRNEKLTHFNMRFQEAIKQQWDLIVLPGSVGADTMRDDCPDLIPDLITVLAKQKVDGKLIGANGATPSIVLASMDGFLWNGATCFQLKALYNKMPSTSDCDLVVHDNIATSQGIGSALVFALMPVELLFDSE